MIARVELVLPTERDPNLLRIGPVEIGQRTRSVGEHQMRNGNSQSAKAKFPEKKWLVFLQVRNVISLETHFEYEGTGKLTAEPEASCRLSMTFSSNTPRS